MTDIVYITGGKSMWNYNELRYSLRSMVKHLQNMGNVFVVGNFPEWLTGVTVIEAEDISWMAKEPRLYRKRLFACRDNRISPCALFCYDDEYLLTDHDADSFPNYYQGTMADYPDKVYREGTHKQSAINTLAYFGPNAKMFDVHCPMLIHRKQFLHAMTSLNWKDTVDGWLIKTAYANLTGAVGTPIQDLKINHPDGTLEEYRQLVAERRYFSTGDNCNFEALEELMQQLYPVASPFEK